MRKTGLILAMAAAPIALAACQQETAEPTPEPTTDVVIPEPLPTIEPAPTEEATAEEGVVEDLAATPEEGAETEATE